MYFETIHSSLCKQNLEEYLLSCANKLKLSPQAKLNPIMVQVISQEYISDGFTNFQYRAPQKMPPKKGSFIRIIDWKL